MVSRRPYQRHGIGEMSRHHLFDGLDKAADSQPGGQV
jgi:hypothetical protein